MQNIGIISSRSPSLPVRRRTIKTKSRSQRSPVPKTDIPPANELLERGKTYEGIEEGTGDAEGEKNYSFTAAETTTDQSHLPRIKGNTPSDVLIRVYRSPPVHGFKASPKPYRPKHEVHSEYRFSAPSTRAVSQSPFSTAIDKSKFHGRLVRFTPILEGRRRLNNATTRAQLSD